MRFSHFAQKLGRLFGISRGSWYGEPGLTGRTLSYGGLTIYYRTKPPVGFEPTT